MCMVVAVSAPKCPLPTQSPRRQCGHCVADVYLTVPDVAMRVCRSIAPRYLPNHVHVPSLPFLPPAPLPRCPYSVSLSACLYLGIPQLCFPTARSSIPTPVSLPVLSPPNLPIALTGEYGVRCVTNRSCSPMCWRPPTHVLCRVAETLRLLHGCLR